ncbi:MAG TPA: cytidylate kinase family protein [Rectinemataceae bacterium]|nr:cytidylate kinase family protein [Rectinemataceae bacterium]
MAIITIARGLATLGEDVAKELGSITGYRLIDREYIEDRLGEFGISADKRQKYDEKKPGFWASLSQERDDYLHFLKTALFEEAADGDCVIIGRGGQAIFRSVPSLVSVLLVSPQDVRVERIMHFYKCDERHAVQIIEQSDHDRSGFHRYFFSSEWRDPTEYDVSLNTARCDIAQAAALIDATRRARVDSARDAEGRRRIAELLLGQRVVTEIIYGKKVPVHFLEASAQGGRIVLHGVSNTQSAIDAAVAAARTVPGVESVESAIQVVQEFTVMP